MDMNLDALYYAVQEADGPIVAETMSLVFSKRRGDYVSVNDAFGEMEQLRLAGLLMPCAPTDTTLRTMYVCMQPTPAGVGAVVDGADERLASEAFALWVRSDA